MPLLLVGEAHAAAAAIYLNAGLDPRAPPAAGAIAVARKVLGRESIYEQAGAPTEAALRGPPSSTRIVLRAGLPLERAHFLVARETARYCLPACSCELLVRTVAGGLVAPPEPFCRRYAAVGLDPHALGAAFCITPTAAMLRANEVLGFDLVIVGATVIHRRARGLLGKLSDTDLRLLALRRPPPKSLRRIVLRDDGVAVALLAL